MKTAHHTKCEEEKSLGVDLDPGDASSQTEASAWDDFFFRPSSLTLKGDPEVGRQPDEVGEASRG